MSDRHYYLMLVDFFPINFKWHVNQCTIDWHAKFHTTTQIDSCFQQVSFQNEDFTPRDLIQPFGIDPYLWEPLRTFNAGFLIDSYANIFHSRRPIKEDCAKCIKLLQIYMHHKRCIVHFDKRQFIKIHDDKKSYRKKDRLIHFCGSYRALRCMHCFCCCFLPPFRPLF